MRFRLISHAMIFNVKYEYLAAGFIPSVEGVSECGNFRTAARLVDIIFLADKGDDMIATYVPIRRTQRQIKAALSRYARRHNLSPSAVATGSMSYFAAMLEDEVRLKAIGLSTAREHFMARYPITKKAGPMHVNNWIK